MDVRRASVPEATPSPGRTSPVGPPDTRGRPTSARYRLTSPGLTRSRPGWRTCILPAPDIGIATRAVLHSALALSQPPLPGPQILGNADARFRSIARPRTASPGLARPGPASPGLADALSCLPPDIGIATRALPQAAPVPGRTPPAWPPCTHGLLTCAPCL